ncbi:MFS transporter [uncultured Phascolarctobacterium sp.]|uniref:MFS transporter n=1 Tax=uncultured Phascolarctobacterium sp. TaxID=512296 RepID=UPI0027D9976A|nr:MFS transporter [uncultured Phascolarctobacterium sp.]
MLIEKMVWLLIKMEVCTVAVKNSWLIFILTVGVFGIINTEMGVMGILPLLAKKFSVSITQAGLLISLFALAVALAGPVMPLVFAGFDRKKVMLLVLGVFVTSNIVALVTDDFSVLLLTRLIPAVLHPVYCSLAFSVAAASVSRAEAPKAVAKVIVGVSAGMVLGVPVSSFLASNFSLSAALALFAVVNGAVFLATLFFIPSLPVEYRPACGEQLSVLKKPVMWLAILAVIFMNGAVFGVFGYFSTYLQEVAGFSWNWISTVLLVYGLANIIGNFVGGRLLTCAPLKTVLFFPCVLALAYVAVFLAGAYAAPLVALTLVWGVLGGVNANINQYWIASAAPEAPDFANGLFLTAANLGTMFGTLLCGWFITLLGIKMVLVGGLVFLVFCVVAVSGRLYVEGAGLKGAVEE